MWQAAKMQPDRAIYDLIIKMDETLALNLEVSISQFLTTQSIATEIPNEVEQLAQQRMVAKQSKDWATADLLRKKISELGFEIIDTKEGYSIKKS
jgi:cysteinyl-tRNA synthetase